LNRHFCSTAQIFSFQPGLSCDLCLHNFVVLSCMTYFSLSLQGRIPHTSARTRS
jgi:hypothetical protein